MAIVTTSLPNSPAVTPEIHAIFQDHAQLVFRTAYGVTGNHEDAEDVLQTIFLRLMRREPSPGLKTNPRAYLYRAAVNLSLDIVRSRRRQVLVDDLKTFEEMMSAELAGNGEQQESQDDKLHLVLYQAIAELKPRSAEILILRYVHNKSDAEIAKTLGVSRGAIALRAFRARARLKRLLRAQPGEQR